MPPAKPKRFLMAVRADGAGLMGIKTPSNGFVMIVLRKIRYFQKMGRIKTVKIIIKNNTKELEHIPECSGVYFLTDEKGNIIYSGTTNNIKQRIISHHHNGFQFTSATFSCATTLNEENMLKNSNGFIDNMSYLFYEKKF